MHYIGKYLPFIGVVREGALGDLKSVQELSTTISSRLRGALAGFWTWGRLAGWTQTPYGGGSARARVFGYTGSRQLGEAPEASKPLGGHDR